VKVAALRRPTLHPLWSLTGEDGSG